jgi:hypothetical protein
MLTKKELYMEETKKQQLIQDIQNLLNTYEGIATTHIDPAILSYMDEIDLKKIIEDLLIQKENLLQNNKEWLEQFKKEK